MNNILTVQNLAVSYGHIKAIKKVDLVVNEGEFIVLLGSNGAGKSTLLNAILGRIRPSQGRIIFMGNDITQRSTENIVAAGISIVPEGRGILPLMSVMENLQLGAHYIRHGFEEYLNQVFTLFPPLSERKKQLAGTLSGGEQQMLAIGRALMSRPKLLLMDEPSLGLAPIIINHVYEVIKDLKKRGQTMLITEQNVRKALKYADRGYVLDLGNCVLNGTCQELSQSEVIRKTYLGVGDSLNNDRI
jgi:branched-chain amino acid transport system ATP-binding protein